MKKAKTCEYSDEKKCKITGWKIEENHCNSCASYEEKIIGEERQEKKDEREH